MLTQATTLATAPCRRWLLRHVMLTAPLCLERSCATIYWPSTTTTMDSSWHWYVLRRQLNAALIYRFTYETRHLEMADPHSLWHTSTSNYISNCFHHNARLTSSTKYSAYLSGYMKQDNLRLHTQWHTFDITSILFIIMHIWCHGLLWWHIWSLSRNGDECFKIINSWVQIRILIILEEDLGTGIFLLV